MPELVVDQVSISLALVGGYISTVGLITYLAKERLYLSEPLMALVFGIAVGPQALNWFKPNKWAETQEERNELTFQIVRIVIGIQVLFAGIALPKAYLRKEWRSILMLLLPVMSCAFLASSLLVWGLFPELTFLEALVIGACVAPTDPVLANSITKGRFAESHVPRHVRDIIVAESGANDGLGVPFIYLPLYILLWKNPHNIPTLGSAIGKWFYDIWAYQILLSCVEGAVIGYVARKGLKYAKLHHLIDHDNFLAYGVGLTFFTLGVVGLLGGDDLLACFIVGNSASWDDFYRLETEDEAFQDVIDTLLNQAVFIYLGAILPWDQLTNAEWNLTPWRFVVLGILILLFRRLPFVVGLTKAIPVFATWRESAFSGWFGPIGVSAVYYIETALRVLPDDEAHARLRNTIGPVVYFVIFSSVLVHGFTVPVVKLSTQARVLTRTWSVQSSGMSSTVDVREHARATLDATPTNAQTGATAPPTATTIRFAEETEAPASDASTTTTTDVGAAKLEQPSTPLSKSTSARLRKGERAYVEGQQVVIESSADGAEAKRVVSRKAFEEANGADVIDRS